MPSDNINYHNPNKNESSGYSEEFCSLSCLKFSVHLFNLAFFLSGCGLGFLGFWTLSGKHSSLILLTSGLYDLTGYILIVSSLFILAISIMGCLAINKSSHCFTLSYSICLIIIIIAQIGVGTLAYIYRDTVSEELSDNLGFKFRDEYGFKVETTEAVDQLQSGLNCCGVESFEDWKDSKWFESLRGDNKVPDSCCITPSKYCGVRDHPSNIRYTGCIERIGRIAGDHLILVGAVALGVGIIQIIGTCMALALFYKLQDLSLYG